MVMDGSAEVGVASKECLGRLGSDTGVEAEWVGTAGKCTMPLALLETFKASISCCCEVTFLLNSRTVFFAVESEI